MYEPNLSPLAIAVLELLHERPMHPYEISQIARERGHDQIIKLRAASLYSTVERLAKTGLIEEVGTNREGRRPERTVYRITDVGADSLMTNLRVMLSEPAPEYPVFAAALAFIGVVSKDEAVRLLEWRVVRLEAMVAAGEVTLSGVARAGIPRLFTLEGEFALELRRTEMNVARTMADGLRSGDIPWPYELTETTSAITTEEASVSCSN